MEYFAVRFNLPGLDKKCYIDGNSHDGSVDYICYPSYAFDDRETAQLMADRIVPHFWFNATNIEIVEWVENRSVIPEVCSN